MNPWVDLPTDPPFILPVDAEAVRRFNEKASDAHRVRAEIIPEPYLGNPRAPVVLLNLNPGFAIDDRVVHTDSVFNDAARRNLLHAYEPSPFYLLEQNLKDSPGREWWMKKLRRLVESTSLKAVARNVFVAEIHGYHSMRFSAGLAVPSQRYTISLVIAAVERGAEIVVMRGWREWVKLVPDLQAVDAIHHVRNVQNPTISPGNIEGFDRLVAAVAR